MTCRYCGTVLPDGALFCGECGQPVAAAATENVATDTSLIVLPAGWPREPEEPVHPAAGFSIADLAFSSAEGSEPGDSQEQQHEQEHEQDREQEQEREQEHEHEHDHDHASGTTRCPQCGAAMARGDVFCGECGFVVRTVTPPSGINLITLGEFPADPEAPTAQPAVDDADATTEVERLDTDAPEPEAEAEPEVESEAGPGGEWATDDQSASDSPDADHVDDGAYDDAPADADDEPDIDNLVVEPTHTASDDLDADPDLDFDDPLPFVEPQIAPSAQGSPRSRPIPDPFPWGIEQPLREDLEATRLVTDSGAGTRYVLQFSTGESVTVAGSGLIGRNPSVQPGEYVDQLVPIFDAGKSVSKTHLEFGQEAGRFWVSDRYSTNGSVIRQPDAEPRRCDAGRRYFIARGTRVDIGEQFFVVS